MDITLHTQEQGQGEDLILLHGNGEDSSYFRDIIPILAKHYHVIAIDTRGHGKTPRGTAPFCLKQFALDLHYFCKKRNIQRAHLLGFSDGANIALLFALRYPYAVRSLILNGANLSPFGLKAKEIFLLYSAYAAFSLFAPVCPQFRKKQELFALMVKEPWIRKQRLHALPMPTLVIAGTHDMIRNAHTIAIFRSIPNSTLSLLHGDHFIAVAQPKAFCEEVLHFLKESALPQT